MTSYTIINTISGIHMGVYTGSTPAEALDEMARAAGYTDYAAACEVAPVAEGELAVEPMSHARRGRNIFASIRHNDAVGDDPRRVMLERTYRGGRFVWVESDAPDVIVADGATRTEATAALVVVYSSPQWDLRIQRRVNFRSAQ
jgi:hypothetical protein